MSTPFAKKAGIALAAVLLVGGIGVFMRPAAPPAAVPVPAPMAGPEGSLLTTSLDAVNVYQKAFWRRPAPDDKILHAERREWTAPADGVRKWQWFIALQPGTQTREWIATNPFALIAAPPGFSPAGLEHRPAWFPAAVADHEIRQNGEGRLIWIQPADRTMLFATDSGFGFAAPASKP